MNDQLYCLELDGDAASSPAAFELLDAGCFQYSAQTEAGTGVTNYIFYTESEPELKELAAKVEASRPVWAASDVSFGPSRLSSIKKEDWTEVWKQYFKVQKISPTLVIKASWLEHVQERPDEVVVEIDPGMSFGTGSHETTQYCLKIVEELSVGRKGLSFLDAGCGSGILSIAAWKLGYRPVKAFDFDPECLVTTKENLERNHLRDAGLEVVPGDANVFDPGQLYDVVVANIISGALIAASANIASWVKPGGHLILAGILEREYGNVRDSFLGRGLTELSNFTEKDWTGALFLKPKA